MYVTLPGLFRQCLQNLGKTKKNAKFQYFILDLYIDFPEMTEGLLRFFNFDLSALAKSRRLRQIFGLFSRDLRRLQAERQKFIW